LGRPYSVFTFFLLLPLRWSFTRSPPCLLNILTRPVTVAKTVCYVGSCFPRGSPPFCYHFAIHRSGIEIPPSPLCDRKCWSTFFLPILPKSSAVGLFVPFNRAFALSPFVSHGTRCPFLPPSPQAPHVGLTMVCKICALPLLFLLVQPHCAVFSLPSVMCLSCTRFQDLPRAWMFLKLPTPNVPPPELSPLLSFFFPLSLFQFECHNHDFSHATFSCVGTSPVHFSPSARWFHCFAPLFLLLPSPFNRIPPTCRPGKALFGLFGPFWRVSPPPPALFVNVHLSPPFPKTSHSFTSPPPQAFLFGVTRQNSDHPPFSSPSSWPVPEKRLLLPRFV